MALDLQYCTSLLQSCNTKSSIFCGKQIHLFFLKKGLLGSSVVLGNRLLQVYARCGSIGDARKLFDEMRERNCFSWNTMIEGYLKSGEKRSSLELFNRMPHKNEFSWNVVVLGLAKAGEADTALSLLDRMPRKNGVVLNSVIHSFARNGCARKAIELFKELKLTSDPFVLATVIGACTDIAAIQYGKQIHARLLTEGLEFDSVLASSLINLYGKCGDLDTATHVLTMMENPDDFSLSAMISGFSTCGRTADARKIFDGTSDPCIVLWNSMISGYVGNNESIKAFDLFNQMRKSGLQGDSSSVSTILGACSSLRIFCQIKQIHCYTKKIGLNYDIVIACALIDAYSKCQMHADACKLFDELEVYDTVLLNSMITIYLSCGRIEEAKKIFKRMENRSLISWNSMIVGLGQNGCPIEAIETFCEMNKLGMRIDKFSLAGVISACASISFVEFGEQAFARATQTGLDTDQIISTSFIDLYCKCGLVEHGRKIFDLMIKSDEVSWNSMLTGYATNGYGFEALALFQEMRTAGVRPTGITFTAILSACDHCGLVDEGRKWFNSMKCDYHIDPGIEHYSCMADLLSRVGFLVEAIDLIKHMPFRADSSMWLSVLRGCVAHGEEVLGKKVADQIIKLEPDNSGAYVQLSSIFSTSGDWERSALVRRMMTEKQVQKNPGHSWANH